MKKFNSEGFGAIEVLVILVVVGLIGAAGFYVNNSIKSKDKQLSTTQAEKESAQAELLKTQAKLNQLDSPAMKANNEKRKADLALFSTAVKQYKAGNKTFPSTEPSSFKKQFVDVYIVNKVPDFIDPNTKQVYAIVPVAPVQTPPGLTLGSIQYQWAGECAGSEFKDTADDSKAAARILLETGETYCLNI